MTPAEELRAAATTLRETAAKATEGPWKASPVWSPRSHCRSAVYSYAHRTGTAESIVVASGLKDRAGGIAEPGNAVWIALAHPGLAEPLAAWLESAALLARTHKTDPAYEAENSFRWCLECNNEECEALQHIDKALAVARVINGGAQ
jgi:hypothetical protein